MGLGGCWKSDSIYLAPGTVKDPKVVVLYLFPYCSVKA